MTPIKSSSPFMGWSKLNARADRSTDLGLGAAKARTASQKTRWPSAGESGSIDAVQLTKGWSPQLSSAVLIFRVVSGRDGTTLRSRWRSGLSNDWNAYLPGEK